MVVAIPARDEAGFIRECIRSVDQAAAEVAVPVLVVVAADSCTDDTFDVARSTSTEFCELAVIEGVWGRAGAARRSRGGVRARHRASRQGHRVDLQHRR